MSYAASSRITILLELLGSSGYLSCSGSSSARSMYSQAMILLMSLGDSGGQPGKAPGGFFLGDGLLVAVVGAEVVGADMGQVVRGGPTDGLEKIGRCRAEARDGCPGIL